MKKVKIHQIITLVALLAFATSITSCNRGYGCPNNFSIEKTAVDVLKTAVDQFVKK